MKQEDKQLLLRDLCGRIPYHVKGSIYDMIVTISSISINGFVSILDYPTATRYEVHEFKPYLFPLSSMTEEQKEELKELCNCDDVDKDGITYNEEGTAEVCWTKVSFKGCSEVVDWLNRNHFDYLGLIGRKLALDATGLNIY